MSPSLNNFIESFDRNIKPSANKNTIFAKKGLLK